MKMEVRERGWPSGSFDSEIAYLSVDGDLNERSPVDAPLVGDSLSFLVECPECGAVEVFDTSKLMESVSSDPRDPDVEYLKMPCGFEWCLNGGVPVVVNGSGACLFSDGTYLFLGFRDGSFLRAL